MLAVIRYNTTCRNTLLIWPTMFSTERSLGILYSFGISSCCRISTGDSHDSSCLERRQPIDVGEEISKR